MTRLEKSVLGCIIVLSLLLFTVIGIAVYLGMLTHTNVQNCTAYVSLRA